MHVSVSCRVWGKSFCVWFIALDCRPGPAADWGWSTDRMCESGEPVCQSESCHWQHLSELSVSNCLLDEGGLYIWTHRRSTHSLVCSICNYILSQTITRTPVVPNWSRCAGILFQPYINIAIYIHRRKVRASVSVPIFQFTSVLILWPVCFKCVCSVTVLGTRPAPLTQ